MKTLLFFLLLMSVATGGLAADVTLSWDQIEVATGYKIQHSQDAGITWDAGMDVGNVTQFTYLDVSDTGYQLFRAVSYNNNDEAIRYSAGVFYCGDCGPPPVPSMLGAE